MLVRDRYYLYVRIFYECTRSIAYARGAKFTLPFMRGEPESQALDAAAQLPS